MFLTDFNEYFQFFIKVNFEISPNLKKTPPVASFTQKGNCEHLLRGEQTPQVNPLKNFLCVTLAAVYYFVPYILHHDERGYSKCIFLNTLAY